MTLSGVVLAAALLTACGGGGAGPDAQPSASDGQKRALWAFCCDAVDGADNWRLQRVLDWAEQQYPALFPTASPGSQATLTFEPYTYRAYSNGNTIGLTSTDIYLLGPVAGSNTTLLKFQSIADFCQQQPGVCPQVQTIGLTVDGLQREFVLYKPAKAEGKSAVPVVFALHGAGDSGNRFMQTSGWRAVADREGFMVAFPSALKHCYFQDTAADTNLSPDFPAEARVEALWGTLPLGVAGLRPVCSSTEINQLQSLGRITAREAQESDRAVPDEVRFFRAMSALLVREHAADPKRLYAAGFANGAELTQSLASRASDLFAALSAASGALIELPLAPAARPLSMVLSLGADEGAAAPVPVDRDVATLPAVGQIIQAYLRVLNLSGTRSFANVTVEGYNTGYYQFNTSRDPSAASNVLHVGIMAGLGSRFPPELPNTLWAFFSTQRLP